MKANVIFLEAPAGVGYSSNSDEAYEHTDEKTGADNAKALELWFEKFTAYKNREFFIAGSSYGGMYVPYTANAVIQANLVSETD
jgi:carboxypeptidase C (cathepsin A)